ncbi:DUF4166 domain-containing protein [Metabacillus niabensis]|uniref:DUF4166 domain-containing protein n=1 Tax=Metabacillus TaxID=2675233 RepID=UPI0011A4F36A
MSIYRELLGENFSRLHPKLQERYDLTINKTFYASGTMLNIESGKWWIKPFLNLATRWKFLFPEEGKNVPFTIKNSCRKCMNGEDEIYWERMFYFDKAIRHFNAFMTIDSKRKVVKDYLGEPSLFYSDLHFEVTDKGYLRIKSGSQRIVISQLEIPIPHLFQGVVDVEEGYDDVKEVYTIKVTIRNRLIGRLIAYEGIFKPEDL